MLKAQTIDGKTRQVGLLGYPVAHSLSPQIHNHAFRELGLPFVYVPLEVKPGQLEKAVSSLRALGYAGANVTIPHKQGVMALCDEVSPLSKLAGTVNTVYFKNNRLCGTTTDAEGFYQALAWMGHDPHGGNIVILGNGGVARTLGFSLAKDNVPKKLTFVGRNSQKVSALADDIRSKTALDPAITTFDNDELTQRMSDCTLLVNCTSVGMHPNIDESPLARNYLNKKTVVFDTVYNPSHTKLHSFAQEAGCPTQNGMRMLLYQGLASFKYWTGVNAPESLFDIDELQKLVSV